MKSKVLWLLIALALLLGAQAAVAQTATTGQVTGAVTDNTGAAIPGAKVTLTSDTGVVRQIASDAEGRYRFVLLPPGVYKLRVEAPGFQPRTLDTLNVKITETSTVDAPLSVAGVTETVNVTGEVPLVQSSSATAGRVIEDTQIRQLPLPTRNFQQILALSPGAVAALSNNTELGRGDTNIDVNGQRTTSNNVVIDGTAVNSPGTNGTGNLSVPAPDTIQEFIVQTSLYDATQGRNSGGNVAVVTKSGSDAFHGNAYEFLRNDSLNANDWFLKRADRPRPRLMRNQFGGTFGGPIVKDKTFFFVSYQGTRERNGASLTNSLMFANIPAGLTDDRSAATLTALATAYGVTLSPISQAILQAQLPTGEWAVPSAAANSLPIGTPVVTPLSRVSDFREDQFNVNIDQAIGTKNHLAGRFFFSDDPQYQANFSFVGANPYQVPGYGGYIDFHNRVLSVTDTHILTPNLINQARFGYSRIYGPSHPEEPFTNSEFGINNPLAAKFPGMSNIQVLGLFSIGPTGLADQWSKTQTFEGSDMLSWTHGRHFLRVGGEMQKYLVDFSFNIYSRGQINFNTFGQFLAGTPYVTLLGNGVPDRNMRATDFAFFAQDDIRATDSLTLNFGVRMGRTGGISEAHGRLVNFDPATFAANTTAGQCTLATPCSNAGFNIMGAGDPINQNDWHVAPRFGFAWKPLKKDTFVVRGGAGVYFDRFSTRLANLQVFNYPFDMVAANLGTGFNPFSTGTFANPFPAGINTTFPLNAQVPAPVTYFFGLLPEAINGIYVDPKLRTPYTIQYNLGFQWEPARNWMIDAGYVGSKGTKLISVYNLNQSPGNAPFTTNAPGAFTTNKSLFGLLQARSEGSSNYNSLQTSLTHRFAHGLQLLASYTYSKSLDYGSGAIGNELAVLPGDQQGLSQQYGPSDFDRRHRFVVSGLYDLPAFYKGDSGAAKRLINDWQLSTIMTFQSGSPFSVVCNNSTTQYSRGNLTGTAWQESGSVESRLANYFNPAGFTCGATASAPSTTLAPYGDSGRNIIVGPNQKNIDLALVKFFPITERTKLEFRSEFFNAFNMVNFANPQTNLVVPTTVGKITSTAGGPRVIQFALKLSF